MGYIPRDSVYEYLQHQYVDAHIPAWFYRPGGSIRPVWGRLPFFTENLQEEFREVIETVKEGAVTSRTAPVKRGAARAHQ